MKRQLFSGLYGMTSTAEEEGDEEPLLEERIADVPDEAGETSTSPPTGGVLGAWVDSIYAWLQPSLGPISMFLNDNLANAVTPIVSGMYPGLANYGSVSQPMTSVFLVHDVFDQPFINRTASMSA